MACACDLHRVFDWNKWQSHGNKVNVVTWEPVTGARAFMFFDFDTVSIATSSEHCSIKLSVMPDMIKPSFLWLLLKISLILGVWTIVNFSAFVQRL